MFDGKDTGNGIFTVQLGPVKYRAVWRKMAGYVSTDTAVVILKSLDQTVSVTRSLIMIPIVMFVAVLIALGLVLSWSLGTSTFSGPSTKGWSDYWAVTTIGSSWGGYAGQIAQTNIMVCRLSGRPLPEKEDDMVQAQHWARIRCSSIRSTRILTGQQVRNNGHHRVSQHLQ